MEKILKRFQAGEASPSDIDLLVNVANNIEGNTVCALGDAAAWPIQSFVSLFRDELEKKVRKVPAPSSYVPPPHLVSAGA